MNSSFLLTPTQNLQPSPNPNLQTITDTAPISKHSLLDISNDAILQNPSKPSEDDSLFIWLKPNLTSVTQFTYNSTHKTLKILKSTPYPLLPLTQPLPSSHPNYAYTIIFDYHDLIHSTPLGRLLSHPNPNPNPLHSNLRVLKRPDLEKIVDQYYLKILEIYSSATTLFSLSENTDLDPLKLKFLECFDLIGQEQYLPVESESCYFSVLCILTLIYPEPILNVFEIIRETFKKNKPVEVDRMTLEN
jgi:hypothetical protein